MNERLRPLMDALRMLARQPGAEDVGLLTAERQIDEYIQPLHGAARQSALKRLREAVRTEAKERPSESSFWISGEEYIAAQLS